MEKKTDFRTFIDNRNENVLKTFKRLRASYTSNLTGLYAVIGDKYGISTASVRRVLASYGYDGRQGLYKA